jgi:hypothetical protein
MNQWPSLIAETPNERPSATTATRSGSPISHNPAVPGLGFFQSRESRVPELDPLHLGAPRNNLYQYVNNSFT